MPKRAPVALLIAACVCLLGSGGCFRTSLPLTGDPSLDLRCDDALVVQRATRKAADERDYAAIPHLIYNLRSDNSWVRTMSIRSLQRILRMEETRGYLSYASDAEREHAVQAWQQWYDETGRYLRPPTDDE